MDLDTANRGSVNRMPHSSRPDTSHDDAPASSGRGHGTGRSTVVEACGLAWYKVDNLSPKQVAAMQTMDDARRAGVLSEDEAHEIEQLIRAGHVYGARKRVTQARKQLHH